jgi:hypothetical protein
MLFGTSNNPMCHIFLIISYVYIFLSESYISLIPFSSCVSSITVIPPGGGGSQYKNDGPTVLPSNSPLCGKTLLYQQYAEKEKGGKYRTGKLASSVTSQCLYHDVFIMYLCHFLPNDLYFLKYTIQKIIAPVAEVNLEDDTWTTTHQVTTAGSSLGSEDNVCEDTLSSQSTYKINSGCLYYKASIAPNLKLLNDFEPFKE